MKKVFQNKGGISFLLMLSLVVLQCNARTGSVSRPQQLGTPSQNSCSVCEKNASDIFPSQDFMIKI